MYTTYLNFIVNGVITLFKIKQKEIFYPSQHDITKGYDRNGITREEAQ